MPYSSRASWLPGTQTDLHQVSSEPTGWLDKSPLPNGQEMIRAIVFITSAVLTLLLDQSQAGNQSHNLTVPE